MDPREDGDYTYVPTQLYPTQPEHGPHAPQNLPPLAFGRLRQMSATEHVNATVGNIYIGNCVEPMDWAGEHVGYIIDASDGNYAWHPNCIRQWLWVSKGRRHNGGTWLQRMEHAIKMVFIAVLFRVLCPHSLSAREAQKRRHRLMMPNDDADADGDDDDDDDTVDADAAADDDAMMMMMMPNDDAADAES